MALSLEELAASEVLDCDNKVSLAAQLYQLLDGQSSQRFVGWYSDQSGVGNHAQLFLYGDTPLMLDPTVGLVAQVDFDDIASGKPVGRGRLVDFYWGDEIRQYRDRVSQAVREGRYRPSHLMYWFGHLEAFHNAGGSASWATPGAFYLGEASRRQQDAYSATPARIAARPGGFSNWETIRGAEVASRSGEPDRLVLGESGQVVKLLSRVPISAGDVVEATVRMRASSPTRVALQLVRWCSDTEPEVGSAILPVGPDPLRFSVSHAFENDHDCLRIQLVGLDEASEVDAWAPSVRLNGDPIDLE